MKFFSHINNRGIDEGIEVKGWIGPRRAMLLVSIVLISIAWYFKDNPSLWVSLSLITGIVLIITTILYSMMHWC